MEVETTETKTNVSKSTINNDSNDHKSINTRAKNVHNDYHENEIRGTSKMFEKSGSLAMVLIS